MRTYVLIHRLAIIFLVALPILGVVNAVRIPLGTRMNCILQIVADVTIWGFLIWKIWKQPRKWSLGIGILLAIAFAGHAYFWHRALASFLPEELGLSRSPWSFWAYEIPTVGSAVCCCFLRWGYPHFNVAAALPSGVVEANK